ncbi:AurF N-oxygenase family protein [Smaragdicoccus niigatensis]|uniref:AurF N-oxygenase family protein n=1 Tax=Smaragdicoccus niigatensis TaxID=359359 RepID=UPI000376B277|nr:diiron oxygenase [Smaragdicoccus niigatensis]
MTVAPSYIQVLQTLSEGSVHTHFDAFADIDWDNPKFAINPDDPRWELPEVDPLGSSEWYRSLSPEQRVAIGLWRQANVVKVGLQFENLLIRGLMQYVFSLPNGSPEFRYCTHEATEETHHTQMFQEFVNRSGMDVPGMRQSVRLLGPLVPLVATLFPEWFFTMVLAGEEPIDHVQKSILRTGKEQHPLLERIMQIHIAEEARHISFAHTYLNERVPHLDPIRKTLLSVLFPITMRVASELIIYPTREITTEAGVPQRVVRQVFRHGAEAKARRPEMFSDARALARDIGLMNPVSRRVWKLMGISGRPSRYRGEPERLAILPLHARSA